MEYLQTPKRKGFSVYNAKAERCGGHGAYLSMEYIVVGVEGTNWKLTLRHGGVLCETCMDAVGRVAAKVDGGATSDKKGALGFPLTKGPYGLAPLLRIRRGAMGTAPSMVAVSPLKGVGVATSRSRKWDLPTQRQQSAGLCRALHVLEHALGRASGLVATLGHEVKEGHRALRFEEEDAMMA